MKKQDSRFFGSAIKVVAAAGASMVLLSGCAMSQFKGLAATGVDTMGPTILSMATVDVAIEHGHKMNAKPICVETSPGTKEFVCTGKTADGLPIETTGNSTGVAQANMKVTIDGQQVFEGTASEAMQIELESDE